MAAAYFNANPPEGWEATTAGVEPQETYSVRGEAAVAGTEAEATYDTSNPVAIPPLDSVGRVVAIDCDVPGAERWDLSVTEMGVEMRDQIAEQVQALTASMRGG